MFGSQFIQKSTWDVYISPSFLLLQLPTMELTRQVTYRPLASGQDG